MPPKKTRFRTGAEDEHDIATVYKNALDVRNHKIIIIYNGEDCLKRYHQESKSLASKIMHQKIFTNYDSHLIAIPTGFLDPNRNRPYSAEAIQRISMPSATG